MSQFSDIDIETSENVDINLSPLIDMMFLLLIFFMVTSTFVQQTGMDISKPEASTAQELEDRNISFALTEDGRIMHSDERININRVRAIVSRQVRTQPRPIVIQADKAARTAPLIELIDECKAGGAKRVNVATKKRSKNR